MTKRERELYKKIKDKKWTAIVKNIIGIEGKTSVVETHFNSNIHDIEAILHKIKLDFMTSLEFSNSSFETIVVVEVKEDE